MDFQRFGIDPRLAAAAEGLEIDFFFYEKMLVHAVEKQENLCAKIALDEGREEVLLLPVLQWILSGEARRALVLVQDPSGGDRCAGAVGRLGAGAGIGLCRAARDAEGNVRLEGDPAAAVLVGGLEDLLAVPGLNLRDYGFVVIDGADRIAELPPDSIHKFIASLLPAWERRSLLACAKISVKAKNLAWDLADNPVEIGIDGEIAKAQSVVKETWDLPGEAKLKFLLGLLEREKPERACVFCNLKDTAEEVSRRLEANGIGSDYILGALAIDRKLAVLAKAKSGNCPCLVLTDQGAEGLEGGAFPLVVNYDIPLEPELFVKRIEMLDRADPRAKVVSLACDRYIYGLPAVESYIDATLNALPADESLLAAVDKSEGIDLGQRRGDPRRDGGTGERGRGDGRGAQDRGDGRSGGRGQQRRGDSRRDSNRYRDSNREDRSPDIRRSISDATGGSLDMGGSSFPADKPRAQGEARGEARGQQPSRGPGDRDRRGGRGSAGPRKPEGPRGDGRRSEGRRGDRGQKQAPRAQAPRQPSPRPAANSGSSRPGAASTKNPYDMPIEERMKQYREKYGQGLGPSKQGPQQRGSQAKPTPKGKGSSRGPRDQAQPLPPTPRSAPPGDKPQGFLGQLFGAFKKKG
jgi:ATP-dependent RNA helicase RhlB